ncbi:glycosyltransferase [Floridanema evergladense]|uniref:Glycosyltransferase n=1 Tax=Floridaenema evergladense BLCC-F167 TaxID=3153639 RepID=A0ABV4WRC7_9CYAN
MPIISVIIPTYNAEKTIQKTIESVLNQTFTNFELIIINDGSQDATREILSRILDSRLKVFSYPNAGLAASRNRGIYHASSQYISFLDADDLWTPDKLEAQLQALQNNSQAAVAYSWTDCIDESGQFLRRGYYISASGNVYKKLLLTNFLENGSNPLIRKEAFDKVGGFDESLNSAEDWDMYLRLAACYNFVAVSSVQILYRISATSMSTNVSRMETACLQVINKTFNQSPSSLQYLKHQSLANLYKILIYKSLEALPNKERGIASMRYFRLAIKNDLSFLRARVVWKVLLKIALIMLLPPKQAEVFLHKFAPIFNITTIFGYLQVDS